jgi:hypothetical protein
MIVDAQNNFSSAQVVTASAVSTNTIDLSQARDVGTGATLYVVITVDSNVTAAGAGTVTFQVISSAAANLGSPTILGQTDAIGKAELPAGRRPIVIEVPSTVLAAQPIGQRYLGLQYTVGTGPLTGGSFTANLVKDAQDIAKYYPSGFTVA